MKANRMAWVFLLMLLLGAADAQQSHSSNMTNSPGPAIEAQRREAETVGSWEKLVAERTAAITDWHSKMAAQDSDYPRLQGFVTTRAIRLILAKQASHDKPLTAAEMVALLEESYRSIRTGLTNEVIQSAENGNSDAQFELGWLYVNGVGVETNFLEALKWYSKAAAQDHARAQLNLGGMYDRGEGVSSDAAEAWKWYRKAAEQGDADAQRNLGIMFETGKGVAKDVAEAVKWYLRAAEQNLAAAQFNLCRCYTKGEGVPKDYVAGYKWLLLAAAQGHASAIKATSPMERMMTRDQVAEGQKLARNFKPQVVPSAGSDTSSMAIAQTRPESSGTGFFITTDGFLITNEHVSGNGAQVRLITRAGLISAKVVKVDAANDLALLKAEGKFSALPVASSRSVKLGATVATVGFPNIGLQGFAPKLAKGEIASLSGAGDDARYFQISVPVQPGNSGGALVDERGNVVGVVSAKLSARAALASSGALPENVNYAVKSSFLLGFLESVPEVSAKLKEPRTAERKFEEVVKDAEQAAVLVLVY